MLIRKIEKTDDGFRYHLESNQPAAPSLLWVGGRPRVIPAGVNAVDYLTTAQQPPDELCILEIATMGGHLGGISVQWYHDGTHPIATVEIYEPGGKKVRTSHVVTGQAGYYNFSWMATKTGWHRVDIIPTTSSGKMIRSQVIQHRHYAKPVPPVPHYKVVPVDENTVRLERT